MTKDVNFRGRDILLDANLLVVFIIGYVRSPLLGSGPAKGYSLSDFDLLCAIMEDSRNCFTTPYIIAEVSNLLKKMSEFYAKECHAMLAQLLPKWNESYVASQQLLPASNHSVAIQFGVADMSIAEIAKQSVVILTADGPLAGLLAHKNLEVWHFDVLRSLREAFR